MLKKLSLIFIRFAPFLLALNILFKILLRYYTISTVIISCVDLVTVMVVLIGLIVLSLTFKFCIYHRILLYCVLVCYLLHFVNNILGINFFVTVNIFLRDDCYHFNDHYYLYLFKREAKVSVSYYTE